jgi:hypothetical protein
MAVRSGPPRNDQNDDDGGEEYEVSWRLIAPGMPVFGADGTPLGHVTHALGDPGRDIFDGVGFRHHLWTAHRMAPAAQVARITTRAVYLGVSGSAAEAGPAYQEEHVYRIGQTGFFRHHPGWRGEGD